MNPFRYRIDALRVDGTQSADARDYPDHSALPVGSDLHAFVTAEMDGGALPGAKKGKVRWALPEALLLMRGPTVADLRRWAKVRYVTIVGGVVQPQKQEAPFRGAGLKK